MATWLDYMNNDLTTKVTKHIIAANRVVSDTTLPAAINELVKIRVSQFG